MAFFKISAGDALADIGRFNLQILEGVMRAYVTTNADILSHNLAVIQAVFGKDLAGLATAPTDLLHNFVKLGLLIAPVGMPSFTTASRGAAVTYWRQTMEGKLELSVGTAITGGLSLAIGSETSRQQSDSWACEITWQPGDVTQFLESLRALGTAMPDLQAKLQTLLPAKEG